SPELGAEVVRAFIREHLTASRFRQHLGTPGHRVLCARTHDGRAIGYSLLIAGAAMDETCAGLLHGARPVGVSKFYLDPDFHGTGGAAGLLDAVIDTASADGADSLWLATNVANDRARRFYAKAGSPNGGIAHSRWAGPSTTMWSSSGCSDGPGQRSTPDGLESRQRQESRRRPQVLLA